MAVRVEQLGVTGPQERDAEFEAAFLQHYRRVYGVLFSLVGDKGEAEELALETFWKLWQQPPGRSQNLGGWLYRVATRLGYNALRAAKRRTRYEGAAVQSTLDLSGSTPLDPLHAAERSDDRAAVRATLSRMAERDAQLLILRHSGLSYREIAAAIGVAPNSVGKLLTRAENEFKKLYEAGGSDAPQR